MNSTYLSSIRLSNIGIMLLQRRSAYQAKAVLRDAVKLLRSCFPVDGSVPAQQPAQSEVALQRALSRFSSVEVDSLNLDIDILTYEEAGNDFNTLSYLLRLPLGDYMLVTLRINEDPMAERDQDVDSAILLHNFAVAHVCMGQIEQSNIHFESASRLWRYALRVLANRISHGLLDLFEEENVAFVWGLVVRNLATVLGHLGNVNESVHYENALSMVFPSIDEIDPFSFEAVGAAAA